MAKRDPERTRKIRIAVRYLMEHDCLAKGNQSRLAEHFRVSRQRVHQIVVEERQRAGTTGAVRTANGQAAGAAAFMQSAPPPSRVEA
jgi:hypothetical protein